VILAPGKTITEDSRCSSKCSLISGSFPQKIKNQWRSRGGALGPGGNLEGKLLRKNIFFE